MILLKKLYMAYDSIGNKRMHGNTQHLNVCIGVKCLDVECDSVGCEKLFLIRGNNFICRIDNCFDSRPARPKSKYNLKCIINHFINNANDNKCCKGEHEITANIFIPFNYARQE